MSGHLRGRRCELVVAWRGRYYIWGMTSVCRRPHSTVQCLSVPAALKNAHEAFLKAGFLGLLPGDSDPTPLGWNKASGGPDRD